jgi:DNA primase
MKCPFHGDSHASASVSLEENAFICHACGIKGDTYSIIMQHEGVDFREALSIAETVTGQGCSDLRSEYRRSSRVSGKSRSVLAGRLGVVIDPLPGHEQFRGRLAIPYITRSGVVDIRFRALGHEEPKYLGLPGAKTHMYNVRAVMEAENSIAICEGEIDTMVLHYKVGIPAIGVPGANAWKKHYRRMLQDFDTIYVFADGDQPGQDFARSLAREMQGVVTLTLPEGEDVNSIFLQHGKEYFLEKAKA